MPTVSGSKKILTAGAGFQAGNWASGSAGADLDWKAVASFSRGFDLELGAEALVNIDGAIRQYIAADVSGQASAAARVRAQVQVPLDLFGEAGLAIRLQAMAEAAAGVTLAIGLSAEEFLELASGDPRMRGVPVELLKAFLSEFTIEGGVMAKAAAAAMAYANLALTGRLVASGTEKPGFTIAAEAGAGLKAGAGFRVLARFGVDDPRRWLRRSIDVAVDGSLEALSPTLPPAAALVLRQARVPVKIALRTAFEVGEALAANQGAFRAGDGPALSLRCVQVALEEVQRHVLEHALSFALSRLREQLRSAALANPHKWQAQQALRQSLAQKLDSRPEYPFESDQATLDYWIGLVNSALQLAAAISPPGILPAAFVRPAATVWCSIQLLQVAVRRVTSAQARVAFVGMQPASVNAAFDGQLQPPSGPLLSHINATLGRSANATIGQVHAVRFVRRSLVDVAEELDSSITDPLEFIAGPNSPLSAALELVLENAGAFAAAADGSPSSLASLQIVRTSLDRFFAGPVLSTLRPALLQASGDSHEAALFVDEVLLAPLPRITADLVTRLLDWPSGDDTAQRNLREFCSSVILNLAGRSLVVCADVLLAKALTSLQTELRQLAAHTDDAGGMASILSSATGLDREFVAELIGETLLVAADTFAPMPDAKRRRIRELLHEILGGLTEVPLSDLQQPNFVPNLEPARELALLLGEEIAGNFIRFGQSWLRRVGMLILQELQEIIEELNAAVEQWVEDLAGLVADVERRLAQLVAEIEARGRELEQATDNMLEHLSSLLNRLDAHAGSRNALRSEVRDIAVDEALGVLRATGVYQALPREVRGSVRGALRDTVHALLDTGLFDFVLQAVADLSGETADLLDDIRAIEPGDDIEQAVMNLFLDRLEDSVRGVFGSEDPRLDLEIRFPGGHVNLGRVRIPLHRIVTVIRRSARDLRGIKDRVGQLAEAIAATFEKEHALHAAEQEHDVAQQIKTGGEAHLASARRGPAQIDFLAPAPGAALHGDVPVEIALRNVTRDILATQAPAQQRVFVWVNQAVVQTAEMAVFDVTRRINVGLPDAALDLLHPRSRSRAQVRDDIVRPSGNRAPAFQLIVGKTGGRIHSTPRVNAPPSTLGRPLRFAQKNALRENGGAGVSLRFRVPDTLLQEGVNTITVVVIPGSAAQRVEQVLSFLWQPQAENTRPKVRMPLKLHWDPKDLPAFVSLPRVSSPRLTSIHGAANSKWASSKDKKGREVSAGFATAKARKAVLNASAVSLRDAMRPAKEKLAKWQEAARTGSLRPPPLEKPQREITPRENRNA